MKLSRERQPQSYSLDPIATTALLIEIATRAQLKLSMPRTRKGIILQPSDPCPCESGKQLRSCCLTPFGLRKKVPTLVPPGPKTDYAQDGCYLNVTKNCSRGLTAEHYMSRSVLEVIGPEVTIDGMPWLPKGERRTIGLNSMAARILCERHNNALSPLDAEAGRFVERLRAIYDNFERHSLSRSNKAFLVSGETIELWMLKAVCGFFYSKNAARNGIRVIDDYDFDINLIMSAFSANNWENKCGLYVRAPVDHIIDASLSIKMAPLSTSGGKRIIGGRIWILGIEFDLIFDSQGVNFDAQIAQGWLYRPLEFQFTFERRKRSITLTWPPGNPPTAIKMTQRPRAGMKW